ncbi:amidohydrolase [Nocardioides sp. WG-D5]|uniref:amidohydrolase n=1 Tax=Nocardioides luteus TaxID=1844 RepID=UPI0002029443|nr:amidohydrolase [Nocardioides luteus]EGD40248.1 hydrolase, Ama/HipO/HyuC family [Nocardioidaceae bacterium Broad-1]MBG6098387.1 amidohydrolase [Nocardioides luteus]
MLEPAAFLAERVDAYDAELIDLRRDIHAHPELSWQEHRTTELIAERLEKAGWQVDRPSATGLIADLGEGERVVALRGDMDALPVDDVTTDIWTSTVPGVAHACGHDVHTTALLGAGLALADLHRESPLPGGVRLLFQPAEEVMPGGALHLMSLGALDDVERIFALHCDPTVDVGRVGIRSGALTSAADLIDVHLSGTGGHTSRPHLTGDLVFALAKVTTELPVILSRRMDPRAGVSVVWGKVTAGQIHNVIPAHGSVGGTVRILDSDAWSEVEHVVREVVAEIIAPYGVSAAVDYTRGVPPVSNDEESHQILVDTVREVLGERGAVVSAQSLGGEDFGWYQEQVPGSMFRLGVRTPGGPTYDLHQGDLRIDERAVGVGAKVLAAAAHRTLAPPNR